jgi:uncharacterized membrane protein
MPADIVFWSTLTLGFVSLILATILLFIEIKEEEKVVKSEEEARKVHEEEKEKRETRVELSEEEKKILDIIKERGEVLQSELQKFTSLSSSRISELVKSLEQKGLIKRERHGKTYKITLAGKQE